MRIISIAIILLCINVATSMVAVAGTFPSGVAPPGLENLGDKMTNMSELESNPSTTGFSITELANALGTAITIFMKLVVNAPTAFAFLVGKIIPGDTTVEAVFVGGILFGTWAIYAIALVQLLTRWRI